MNERYVTRAAVYERKTNRQISPGISVGQMYSIYIQCESKKSPPAACGFLTFFDKRLRILNQFFTHLAYYMFLSTMATNFYSVISTKLCHIKRDYTVHVICSKCPPSAETHACRRLRKSLIALLIVICGKSSQICCFYNANKHAGYDMTSTVTSFAQ